MDRAQFEVAIAQTPLCAALRADYARHLADSGEAAAAWEHVQVGLELDAPRGVETGLLQLEAWLFESHMTDIVGAAAPLISRDYPPQFERGQLVEVVLIVDSGHFGVLSKALNDPRLHSLRVLGLMIRDVGDWCCDALADAKLSPLTLNLWIQGDLSPRAFVRMAARPVLQSLDKLYVRTDALCDNHVKALIANSKRRQLKLRSDTLASLTTETAFAIADSESSRSLEKLAIDGSQVGDEGALALATSPKLSNLTQLELRDGTLTNQGARIIAGSTTLLRLAKLDVSRNLIDEAGLLDLQRMRAEVRYDNQHPNR